MVCMGETILICNDDGVHAPGINALSNMLRSQGLDVWVVAPSAERSASSMSISIGQPLRFQKVKEKTFSVDGTPVDSIFMALGQILPNQPDWVLSGINRGGNLGQDTMYSGTVAAAMEAAMRGIRSVAFSLEPLFGKPLDLQNGLLFEEAAKVAASLFEQRKSWRLERGQLLNVNIPSIQASEIRGFKTAKLGKRLYETRMHPKVDPRGNPYFWIGGGGQFENMEESDCAAVHSAYVSLTVLEPSFVQVRDVFSQSQLVSYKDQLSKISMELQGE